MDIRKDQDGHNRTGFSVKTPMVPSPRSEFRRLLRQTLLLAVLAPVVYLTLIGFHFYKHSLAGKEMLLAEQRLIQITAIQTDFLRMQSSMRGYLLTNNQEFLEGFHATRTQLGRAIESLPLLADKNQAHIETLKDLANHLRNWVKAAERFIAFRKKHSEGLPPDFQQTKGGTTIILDLLNRFHSLQTQSSASANSKYLKQRDLFLLYLILGTFLTVISAIFINQGQLRSLANMYETGQSEIQKSELQFRELTNLIPQLIWVASPEGNLEWINDNWISFTGLTREQLLGTSWTLGNSKAKLDQESIELQFPIRGADGVQRWFLVRAVPIKDTNGQIINWFGTNTDIDDEHRERLVSETTGILSQSLDLEIIAQNLATKMVPLLADWSGIVLFQIEGSNTHTTVTVTPGNPQKEDLTRKLLVNLLKSSSPHSLSPQHTKPVVLNKTSPLLAEYEDLLQSISLGTLLIFPITIHKGIIGYVVFMFEDPLKHINDSELALYEKVHNKVSLHFENAFLHHEAKKAIEVRDEFISVASHELKTPLTALTLQIQLLARGVRAKTLVSSEEYFLKSLTFCEQQVFRLSRLLNLLLDLTQIQRGQIKLEKTPSDLVFLAKQAVKTFEEEAKRNSVSVNLITDGTVTGNWDSTRLFQVISNLLSNALKYGQKKPVTVTIKKDSLNNMATLSIEDNGLGISDGMKDKVFERFHRGDLGVNASGLGLGLYISRQITEAHGGEISLESEPGKGSTFTITLPL
jgi:PAS domain S-box-containing protein